MRIWHTACVVRMQQGEMALGSLPCKKFAIAQLRFGTISLPAAQLDHRACCRLAILTRYSFSLVKSPESESKGGLKSSKKHKPFCKSRAPGSSTMRKQVLLLATLIETVRCFHSSPFPVLGLRRSRFSSRLTMQQSNAGKKWQDVAEKLADPFVNPIEKVSLAADLLSMRQEVASSITKVGRLSWMKMGSSRICRRPVIALTKALLSLRFHSRHIWPQARMAGTLTQILTPDGSSCFSSGCEWPGQTWRGAPWGSNQTTAQGVKSGNHTWNCYHHSLFMRNSSL